MPEHKKLMAQVRSHETGRGFKGQKRALELLGELVQRGTVEPLVRSTAIALRRDCASRDELCEVRSIFKGVKHGDTRVPGLERGFGYVTDPRVMDYFVAPATNLEMCQLGSCAGDCFVKGTLVLREDHQVVPIESIRVGDSIWGKDRWSKVLNTWDRGIRTTYLVRLNNGSQMRLTPEHKVWVVDEKTGSESRIPVSELKKGMALVRPERIPFGSEKADPDQARLDGYYISDGWHELGRSGAPSRFAISGKDGHPKEEQKKWVKALCESRGLKYYMAKKYIRVNDRPMAARMAMMGSHAPNKRALSINLDEGGALNLLRGIMADSGKNTRGTGRTFTTTSHALFVQTRVLAKMAGITCGSRFIVDHGGLGKNPIWRLQFWGQNRLDGNAEKLLRVKEIVRDGAEEDCCDLETDDHYVWLPEADWTTSQCDDHAMMVASMLGSLGYMTGLRAWGPRMNEPFVHVYPMVVLPKKAGDISQYTGLGRIDLSGFLAGKELLGLDTTVPESDVGWEPPRGNVLTAWVS